MKRSAITLVALAALAMTSSACNTVKGLGRDIESVGRTGEEVISHAPTTTAEDAQAAR
jgi:predicted small secreted protein